MPDRRKEIVADGYDKIAERYLDWGRADAARLRYLARLRALVPEGGKILDLGCGAGVPVARELSKSFAVTGVDISGKQIALARENAPGAEFVEADIASVEFPQGSFDAVSAFYSLTHVPREEHAEVLARIAAWLKPGGIFLASLGAGDNSDNVENDWLGTPMFFSHFGAEENKRLVADAGFHTISAEVVSQKENGADVAFLWVVARKSEDFARALAGL